MATLLRPERPFSQPAESRITVTGCVLLFHGVQTFIGLMHLSIALKLTSFFSSNGELFAGRGWSTIKFSLVGPFALFSMTILYTQAVTLTIFMKRSTSMNLKDYRCHIYLGIFVVVIAVTNMYLHLNSQIRFSSMLHRDLKHMISEHHNGSRAGEFLDMLQRARNCCGSNDPTDWFDEYARRSVAVLNPGLGIPESPIFPNSCCIEEDCGPNLNFVPMSSNYSESFRFGLPIKRRGCLAVIKQEMTSIWMETNFFIFIVPVVNEVIFVAIILLEKGRNKPRTSLVILPLWHHHHHHPYHHGHHLPLNMI